jgi:hypothetical protein
MAEKPTKSSMDGRVTYQDIDYTHLSAEDMRKAGEKVAEAMPGWSVRVTGGPYRGWDAAYKLKREEKVVELDFYSPRPGLHRVDEMVEEMKGRLLLDDHEDTWRI